MADVSVGFWADSSFGTIFGNFGSSTNRYELGPGDTLSLAHADFGNQTATLYTFSSAIWTVSGNLSMAPDTTASRTVKSSVSQDYDVNISVEATGCTTRILYLKIVAAPDTTPNSFSFDSVTNAIPGEIYCLGYITVTGIDTQVNYSGANGLMADRQIYTGGSTTPTSGLVKNNENLYIYATASSSYNTTTNPSLTVGTLTVSSSITTKPDPGDGTVVPFPISSGTISIDSLREFFGPEDEAASMSYYYRGGDRVPNKTTGTPNNANIPTSGQISLSNFYNSMTYISFSTEPGNGRADLLASTSQSTSDERRWDAYDWSSIIANLAQFYEIGYGPDMRTVVEYKITARPSSWLEILTGNNDKLEMRVGQFTTVQVGNVVEDTTVYNLTGLSSGSVGSGWGRDQHLVILDASVGADSDVMIFGHGFIDLQIRIPAQPTYVYTTTIGYKISIDSEGFIP
jgi:hypothetical protein